MDGPDPLIHSFEQQLYDSADLVSVEPEHPPFRDR
jgi:hypothetical protein